MLKVLSVNIEGQKHIDKILRLLRHENPDVVCMMEVFEDTLPLLSKDYPYILFAPGYVCDQTDVVIPGNRVWGEVIMSKFPLTEPFTRYLGSYSSDNLPRFREDEHAPVLITTCVRADSDYTIGALHGTWSEGGKVTERQVKEFGVLMHALKGKELLLVGDFNVPRGNELYNTLASRWKDNIPLSVTTTIDPYLHYANAQEPGKLSLVVDYMWSTPTYSVSDVRLISGVSDHIAVVGTVSLV